MAGQEKVEKTKISHVAQKGENYGLKKKSGLHLSEWCYSRAQELVEFALIFPVLVFLVIGVFDLGRAFHALIQISNAAREGVRYGINNGIDDNTIPPDGIYETIDNDAITNIVKQEVGNFLDADELVVNSGCVCSEPDPDPDPANDLCPSDPSIPPCVSEARLRVVVEYSYNTIFFPIDELTLVRDMEMMIP